MEKDSGLTQIYVATFLYTFSQALVVPLLSEHLQINFGVSLLFIGIVMGIYGLMQIVLRLPMGDLADRHGRKPSLVVAFVATLVSGLLFAYGDNAWWAVPGVILFGFAGGVYWVAANSYLFDRASDVARATSNYTIAISLAFLIGPPVGHYIADTFGFHVAFLLSAGTNVWGLALAALLPEVAPAPRPRPTTSSYRRAWKLLAHPALVLSAMGTFTYSMLFATHQSFFQLHALAVGMGLLTVGLLLGGRQATSLLVRIGLPALLKRVGAARVMVGGIVLLGLTTALVPFATTLPALIALVSIAGCATGVLIPANLMLVHEGAPTEQRGLANGIYGTMLGLGSMVAPVVFGLVGTRAGLDWAFWGAGALGLALVGAIVLYRARVTPRPAS